MFQEIELQLTGITFNHNKINYQWLNGIGVTVSKLIIQDTNLMELGSEVFAGNPFIDLTYLTIANTKIRNYKKDSFKNANNIATIEIQYNDNKVITMEEDCFGYLANTLATLQIQRCITSNDLLINITGAKATNLNALRTLDIRSNNIGSLTVDSFSKVSYMNILYASDAGLNYVNEAPFANQKFIKLDISSNNLAFLPPKTFTTSNIVGNNAITFTGNNWNCNCSLVWLRDFFRSNQNLFYDKLFMCKLGSEQVPYDTVNFCDDQNATETPIVTKTASPTNAATSLPTNSPTTTPSPTNTASLVPTNPPTITFFPTDTATSVSTNSPTIMPSPSNSPTATPSPTNAGTVVPTNSLTGTTTTPAAPTRSSTSKDTTSPPTSTSSVLPSHPNTFNATCIKAVAELETNFVSDDTITLRQETVTISFVIENENSQGYDYHVIISGNVSKEDNLLILEDSDIFPLKECITNLVYNQIKTSLSLTASKTYTYCLLKNGNLMVDPLDCKSLATPALWENRTFIPNHAKLYCIIGVSVTLLLAVIITCLISFFCIRQHPEWIKSNHRVVIIKEDKTGTRILASPYYDQVPYAPPSLSLQSDNSYLVPTNRNIYHGGSIGSIRTISQNISFAGPSHVDSYNRYRIKKANKRRNRIHSDSTEDNLYESAPPLPPNHPKFSRHPTSLLYSKV